MSSAVQPRGAEAPATGSLIAPVGTKLRPAGAGLVHMHYSASARHKDAAVGTFLPSTLAHRLSYRSKVVTFSSSQPRVSLRRAQSGISSELLPERAAATAATRNFLTKTMSRTHASLVWIDGRPALVDHASTHGTFVSRVRAAQQAFDHLWVARMPNAAPARLEPEKPFLLEDGDLVTLGKDVVRDGKLHQAVRAFVSVSVAQQGGAAEAQATSERTGAAPTMPAFYATSKASTGGVAVPAKNPTRRYGLDSIEISDDEEEADDAGPVAEVTMRQPSAGAGSDVVSAASDSANDDAARGSSRASSMPRYVLSDDMEEPQAQTGAAASKEGTPNTDVTPAPEHVNARSAPRFKSEPHSDEDLSDSEHAFAPKAAVKSEKTLSADEGAAAKETVPARRLGTSAPRRFFLGAPRGKAAAPASDDGNAPADSSSEANDGEADAALDDEDRRSIAMDAESASEAELDDDELENEELDEELEEDDLDEHDDFDANALDADELYANEVGDPFLKNLRSDQSDCEESESASVAQSDAHEESDYLIEEQEAELAEEEDAAAESGSEALPAADDEDDAAADEPFDDQIWRDMKPPCDCDACLDGHESLCEEQEEDEAVDNGSEASEESEAPCDCSECALALTDSEEEEDDEQSEEDAADEPATPESSKQGCQARASEALLRAHGGVRDPLLEALEATWREDDIASLASWKSMARARKKVEQPPLEDVEGSSVVEPKQDAAASTAEEAASLDTPSLGTPERDVSETSTSAVQAGVKRSLDDMQSEETASTDASDDAEPASQPADTTGAHEVAARPSKRARRIAAARNFAAGAAVGALGTFLGLARLGRSYE